MEVEKRTFARMSLEVEQLQWRIRNNLELPPVELRRTPHQLSLDNSSSHNQRECEDNQNKRPKSAPATGHQEEGGDKIDKEKDDVHDLADESEEEKSCHSCTTDFWTSADPCQSCQDNVDQRCEIIVSNTASVKDSIDYFEKVLGDKINVENNKDVTEDEDSLTQMGKVEAENPVNYENVPTSGDIEMVNGDDNTRDELEDVDSFEKFDGADADDASDEGLGDISSSESPQPSDDTKTLLDKSLEEVKTEINYTNNFDKNKQFLDLTNKDNEVINGVTKVNNNNSNNNRSPADERVPSRLPYETTL